jgi:pimeloyl-ACP methyl ester carboxylesterase
VTSYVTSPDGTEIAYDQVGAGPPLVLVVGSFNSRRSQRRLAEALAPAFTVLNYDRRGRGDSGDTQPYAVDREIEDLLAVIEAAGRPPVLFGHSSGGVLSLKTALRGASIAGLSMYEPPFMLSGGRQPPGADLAERISALVDSGQPGRAVDLFYSECLNVGDDMLEALRAMPSRPRVEAVAHTLAYDAAVVGDLSVPSEGLRTLDVPTLHFTGPTEVLAAGAREMAQLLPKGRHLVLEGQTHDVVPAVVAPLLIDFFVGPGLPDTGSMRRD